jgi:hypothetical protein
MCGYVFELSTWKGEEQLTGDVFLERNQTRTISSSEPKRTLWLLA